MRDVIRSRPPRRLKNLANVFFLHAFSPLLYRSRPFFAPIYIRAGHLPSSSLSDSAIFHPLLYRSRPFHLLERIRRHPLALRILRCIQKAAYYAPPGPDSLDFADISSGLNICRDPRLVGGARSPSAKTERSPWGGKWIYSPMRYKS